MKPVVVIDSGAGNLHSVARALVATGCQVQLTDRPEDVRSAERIVVPGQGAFARCMVGLGERGLDQAIREFIASGRPYIGICLGLQILFDESEEHGPVPGLGVLSGKVRRLGRNHLALKVPHMGWNEVHSVRPDSAMAGIRDGSHLYFVHSYCVEPTDPEIVVLRSHHGEDFAAAIRYENLFACQFHPEKSQAVGLAMLANLTA